MIEQLTQPTAEQAKRLLEIWESAVRATHDFLTEEDIRELLPQVEEALEQVELYTCRTAGTIQGFIGLDGNKIEMLFVDSAARGQRLGKRLLRFAVEELGARYVDVNEQNTQGVGFYSYMGFRQTGRSELDGQGRPFPLLHMELEAEKK